MVDCWNPSQYAKFEREREQPFYDLLGLIRPTPDMRVVDLGCGSGRLTRVLHERLRARETVGIDRSAKMLEAMPDAVPGLSFREGTIEAFAAGSESYDLIFSNAAFHWVLDHASLVPRLRARLMPGGQLAFQVPAMHGARSHAIADELAGEEPFSTALGGWHRPQPVLTPDAYARLLYDAGFDHQHVQLTVYPHVLDTEDDVVEWMKGTLLTEYQRHLPEELRNTFVETYRRRLLSPVRGRRPYFFPFQRILCWGALSPQP